MQALGLSLPEYLYRMRISLFIIALLCGAYIKAQDPTPPTDITGEELRDWLKDNWYTPWHNDLGYGPAREAMFGSIDAEAGLIECVYSGFTQAAETTTFPDPMNTEHTVPQSFFNSQTPMRSDIHHLFPTHQQANSTRGSIPYGEVNDNAADEWLIGSSGNYSESGNIPGSNIDDYSEIQHNVAFEPREESKGNTARAIFYFYTMYADNVEAEFADISAMGDLETLYDWHVNDPPDALEIERDEEIQAEQGNYNPYIRMPELAGLAWGFVSSIDEHNLDFDWTLSNSALSIGADVDASTIELLDITGTTVRSIRHSNQMEIADLSNGIYLLKVENSKAQSGVKKLLIAR